MPKTDPHREHHDHASQKRALTFMYVADGVGDLPREARSDRGFEELPATDDASPRCRIVLPKMPRWMPEDFTDDWRECVDLMLNVA